MVANPLMSPTMRCAEVVAAIVRGEASIRNVELAIPASLLPPCSPQEVSMIKTHKGKDISPTANSCITGTHKDFHSDGFAGATRMSCDALPEQYLCSGLDIYLQQEPDAMSCMALVHSRIRRVYYNHPSTFGTLATHTHMHDLRLLNHRYRAFQCSLEKIS